MQLRVWIGTVQRIISGVSEDTTSHHVIVALAQATGKTGRFTLIVKWRDYEKTLTPDQCPLAVAQQFGDYTHEVQFILRQTDSAQNRRLAEAKSPKPQRRRTHIKKSMSFSGGAQPASAVHTPRSQQPLHAGIAEEDCLSDLNYVTPQPRRTVPKPHPVDTISQQTITEPSLEPTERLTRQSTSSPAPNPRPERTRKSKSRERSTDKRESRRQKEAELRLRESLELQQTIANHERRLEEEKRKLHNVDRDISTVTIEEEMKWGRLYDCRDEIGKALKTAQHLEVELEDFDEVLLSEEINVLVLRQKEMGDEMSELQQQIADCELHLSKGREESKRLAKQLDEVIMEDKHLDTVIKEGEEEMLKLQKRVDEKKRFLVEAEDGYMSACDDLKEADNSLEKRKQMLVELERELREYNLKTFISTGFSDKYNASIKNVPNSKMRGLLV